MNYLLDEHVENKVKLPPMMWHHHNKNRMNWDLMVIGFALYNCISIPLEIAFPNIT